VLEAQLITHYYLEPDIEPVPIKLHDLVRPRCWWTAKIVLVAWYPFQVRSSCRPRACGEVAQHFRLQMRCQ
jgi:hypothetical protein